MTTHDNSETTMPDKLRVHGLQLVAATERMEVARLLLQPAACAGLTGQRSVYLGFERWGSPAHVGSGSPAVVMTVLDRDGAGGTVVEYIQTQDLYRGKGLAFELWQAVEKFAGRKLHGAFDPDPSSGSYRLAKRLGIDLERPRQQPSDDQLPTVGS